MSKMESLSHLERTAREPRSRVLHKVTIQGIDDVNDQVRVLRLRISEGERISFLPGQWLDVHVPTVSQAGGFTITSPPSAALPTGDSPGYLELAVQKSPSSAPAAWLWGAADDVLGTELNVRIGGSFVWPPPGVPVFSLRKVVFVAGGVGINPLVSMLSSAAERPGGNFETHVLYSVKDPGGPERAEKVLFLQRIAAIFAGKKLKGSLNLFFTGGDANTDGETQNVLSHDGLYIPFERRRITVDDVEKVVSADKRFAAVYVCGVPAMTDELVDRLTSPNGFDMEPHRVLHEKWW